MTSTAQFLQELVEAAEYNIERLEKQAKEDPEMNPERRRVVYEVKNLYREHVVYILQSALSGRAHPERPCNLGEDLLQLLHASQH